MIPPERAPLQRGQHVYLGITEQSSVAWHAGVITDRDGPCVWVDVAHGPSRQLLSPGQELMLETWRHGDARYSFRTRLVRVERYPRLSVQLRVMDGTRIQRREHFRVPLALTVGGSVIRNGREEPEPVELRLRDISGGGIQAACSRAVGGGDELELNLPLPTLKDPLRVRARVIRVLENPDGWRYPYEVGAAFVDLGPAAREQIIRFTLQVQAEQRRRGLL